MLDPPVRRALAPLLDRLSAGPARSGMSAQMLTGGGWLVGVGACVTAGTGHWTVALVLWLGNRLLDGLDGPLARRTGATDRGGFLDVVADFSVYAGFVVAVGIERPEARVACLVLLLTYYVSGTAFLALSPLLERRGVVGDGRSILFVGGLAEGTETVVAYAAFCLFPGQAERIAWIFAALVAATAVQRVVAGIRVLDPRRTTVDDDDRSRTTPREMP